MAVFFTSDTHFGDHRVLNLYPRPFASVAEMDEGLIARWNETVGEGDEVWHLGDFARTARLAAGVLARLNGRKHLVVGNNDPAPETVPGLGLGRALRGADARRAAARAVSLPLPQLERLAQGRAEPARP